MRFSVLSRLRSQWERGWLSAWHSGARTDMDALLQFSQRVVQLAPSDELSQRLTAVLRTSLQLSGVALYLEAADTPGFKLASTDGRIDAPALVAPDDLTLPNNGAHRLIVPLRRTATDNPAKASGQPRWQACVPVRVNGSTLGLIALASERTRAKIPDADVTLLALVAAQVAVSLQNARYATQLAAAQATLAELRTRLETDTVALHAEPQCAAQFTEIVGDSPALRRVLCLIEKVAPTTASILISGETGTGKELIARAVHQLSPRCAGPLVSVNCPAIPPTLAESELFGHERGAFTDAVEARPGKFEQADGGTIFLDEIAELSPEMQVKLLRVLQERETQRVGGRKTHKLDLRVVAATNRDLHAEMRAQHFREDLYYRLAAVVVYVPPLRARPEDIPMLASHFLDRASVTYGKPAKGFSADAMAALRRYPWPGNVRELQHVVDRAVLLSPSDVIRPEHLSGLALAETPRPTFSLMLREEKLRRIQHALAQTGGNQAAAARLLGVSRSNLGRLIKALGVRPPRQE